MAFIPDIHGGNIIFFNSSVMNIFDIYHIYAWGVFLNSGVVSNCDFYHIYTWGQEQMK